MQGSPRVAVRLCVFASAFLFLTNITPASAQTRTAPGGFVESATSTATRPMGSASTWQNLLPQRGEFQFPSPYNTRGIRITNPSDCGGGDCVRPIGYSYWRNTNNHVGSDTILIAVALDRRSGGTGPTLFTYSKSTGATRNAGPIFDSSHALSWGSGEGWYFSASRPSALYVNNGSQMLRHDVLTKQSQVVVDLAQHLGGNRVVWQMHSSHDDNVHSFTVKDGSGADLGCGVYAESTRQFRFFQRRGGEYDECQVDASGRYVLIKEDADGQGGLDNLVYDLTKGTSVILSDPQGALGHSDMGFGYGVGEDNYYNAPGAMRVWQYGSGITDGRLVFRATDWNFGSSHVSHTNARGDVPLNQQMACLSNANRRNLPRTNEISCFLLDGSLQVLVVAPVMTNLDASGGGDDYSKAPKGNLDPTGEFFLWTSNMGGNRLDVFMVHVPRPKLGSMPSTPSPSPSPSPSPTPSPSPSPTPAPAPTPSLTVAITSHQAGQQVGGVATITASASSPAGIVGVQFQIDGKDVAVEDTKAPYELSWNTRGVPNGTHTVSAVARDRNGVKRAAAVSLNVSNANRRVRGDLNGDYQPDLLFSHTSGSLTSWILQGVARNRNQEVTPGYHDPQWRAVAVEDFNADDKVDIVWQHAQYGYVKIWLMDGTVRLREITPGPGSTSWRVAAAGDVDGDGHTDIIWQHASTHQLKIWLMRMTSLWIEVGTNPSQIYTGWKVVGAADLNRDGRSDLIIRHTGGSIAGWYMRGNRVIASRSLGSQWASPEWEVKAARDMNGDGYPDLVWQHRQSLQMYVWYLRDHQSYQDTYLNPTATGGGWTLAAQ